jgi:hypothetical protein
MQRFLEDPPPAPRLVSLLLSLLGAGGRRYRGHIDEEAFQLTMRAMFKVAYLPCVRGEFAPDAEGTRVRGLITARVVEMAAIVGGAVLGATFFRSVVVLEVGLAAHAVGYLCGFLPHERTFEAWLTTLPGWEQGRPTMG